MNIRKLFSRAFISYFRLNSLRRWFKLILVHMDCCTYMYFRAFVRMVITNPTPVVSGLTECNTLVATVNSWVPKKCTKPQLNMVTRSTYLYTLGSPMMVRINPFIPTTNIVESRHTLGDFGDFVPGCWLGIQATYLKIWVSFYHLSRLVGIIANA